jgi:hypothetical protein
MTRGHRCHPLSRRDASSRLQDRESSMQVEVQLAAVCRYVRFKANPYPGFLLALALAAACLASRLKGGRQVGQARLDE